MAQELTREERPLQIRSSPEKHLLLRDRFLEGMSNAASTVNIVTTDGVAGRAGLTVSAMSSVSADPPSLLICVNAQSKSADIINANGVFCVNVLTDSQIHISDSFSGRRTINEKFACAAWTTQTTGAPALDGALVNFDCELKKSFQWGSHYIFIGEIVSIALKKTGNPLIYANRAYGKAVKITSPTLPAAGSPTTRAKYRIGSFVTASASFMPGLMASYLNDGYTDPVELVEGSRQDLLDGVLAGALDLAVIYQRETFNEAGLEAQFIVEVPPYVLLPSVHPLAKRGGKVSLRELAALPLISLATPSAGPGFINGIFLEAGIEPCRAFQAPSFEAMRGMVGNGLGYAITFTHPASRMSYDGMALVRLPIAEPVRPGQLVIVHRAKAELSPDVVAFLTYCTRHFQRLIAN